MIYYVLCTNINCNQKIFINFEQLFPLNRETIRRNYPGGFGLTCPNNHNQHYTAEDVRAEAALLAATASGAMLGGLLYLIHPTLGLLGFFSVGNLARISEINQAYEFNRSR